jgi:hypothetical protein
MRLSTGIRNKSGSIKALPKSPPSIRPEYTENTVKFAVYRALSLDLAAKQIKQPVLHCELPSSVNFFSCGILN